MNNDINFLPKQFFKFIFYLIIIIILFFIFAPFGTVGAGERGVLLRFNAVTGKILNEGLYFYIPFIEQVKKIDIKIQKEQVSANAASKDLQTISSVVALNFHIMPDKVAKIYQEVGIDYKNRIIDPALQEAVKASTALFTAEELITKREIVKEKIKFLLKERLEPRGLAIDEFNIVNFEFSRAFNEAIENKVTAEQQALAAKNKLEQVKFEAEQKVAEAKGKAEAIRIEAQALRDNPQVLQLRALEKWDGKLPQFMGSNSVPFINVK
ncbi:MAG TPA: prohibitin family protein [bacterium]|nr:prohibitin family protein [bacterium]HOL47793.1 prohibitin family protein [bacterium]HPQ18628.1 prohibitin family protein [bacterium]